VYFRSKRISHRWKALVVLHLSRHMAMANSEQIVVNHWCFDFHFFNVFECGSRFMVLTLALWTQPRRTRSLSCERSSSSAQHTHPPRHCGTIRSKRIYRTAYVSFIMSGNETWVGTKVKHSLGSDVHGCAGKLTTITIIWLPGTNSLFRVAVSGFNVQHNWNMKAQIEISDQIGS